MTVKGIYESDGKPLTTLGYDELRDEPLIEPDTIGLKGSPTNVFKSFSPPVKGVCKILGGTSKEAVGALFDILSTKHIV
jgi:electron transfer flavoprotein beta subunit